MTTSNQSAGGPYRAEFGTIYQEDASGFLFGVIPASYADDVARSLNLAHRPVPAPSSLAGGEMLDRFERAAFAKVQNLPRGAVERAEEIARRDAEYDAARNAILASLSPKGSARVGAALSFECSNCNVAEPEWCMSAGHCAHRDGDLAPREEAPAEGAVISWEGTEEQEQSERLTACSERRAQWGDDDCEARDGSCQECTLDMAAALETEASKALRAPDALRAAVDALEPFARFAENVDSEGWASTIHRERISVWFGPSDFRRAAEALAALKAEGA